MPDISVIIPSFNRAHCLPRAIDSVMKQSYPPRRIVVIDDGSVDGTAELIKMRYPQVDYIWQENAGVSAARNQGVGQLTTDWVALLDSDDEWLPHKLEKQVSLLNEHPEAKFCHTEEIWIRAGRRVNQMKKHQKSGGWIFEKCLPLCAISPSSVLMHRSLFEKVGLFREDLPACEDYDLWLKICASHPVLYIKEPCIIKYGGHDDQLSTQHWGMDRFRIQSLTDLLKGHWLDEKQKQVAKIMLTKKIVIFLKGAKKRKNVKAINRYEQLLSNVENL